MLTFPNTPKVSPAMRRFHWALKGNMTECAKLRDVRKLGKAFLKTLWKFSTLLVPLNERVRSRPSLLHPMTTCMAQLSGLGLLMHPRRMWGTNFLMAAPIRAFSKGSSVHFSETGGGRQHQCRWASHLK